MPVWCVAPKLVRLLFGKILMHGLSSNFKSPMAVHPRCTATRMTAADMGIRGQRIIQLTFPGCVDQTAERTWSVGRIAERISGFGGGLPRLRKRLRPELACLLSIPRPTLPTKREIYFLDYLETTRSSMAYISQRYTTRRYRDQ